MFKKPAGFLGGVALWVACGSVSAAQLGGVLYANLDIGGDTLITTSKGDVDAGALVHFAGGIALHDYASGHLETQLTIGMKADRVAISKGEASFQRWPVELMQFFKVGNFRIGAGASYHLDPEAECDIDDVCDTITEFDDALGYVGQIDFVLPLTGWMRELTVGARATFIDYEIRDSGLKIEGDSVGVSLGISF